MNSISCNFFPYFLCSIQWWKQTNPFKDRQIHEPLCVDGCQYSFGTLFNKYWIVCFLVIIRLWSNHSKLNYWLSIWTKEDDVSNSRVFFLSSFFPLFIYRSKRNTPNSFVIWFVKWSAMLHMKSDAWSYWKFQRISGHWNSARLVWVHTSVESESVKNCPTSWPKCVKPVMLSKQFMFTRSFHLKFSLAQQCTIVHKVNNIPVLWMWIKIEICFFENQRISVWTFLSANPCFFFLL